MNYASEHPTFFFLQPVLLYTLTQQKHSFFLGTCCPIYFVDNLVPSRNQYILCNLQVISYMRGPLLFIFNFHPTDSYEQYNVGVEEAGEYQVSVIFL